MSRSEELRRQRHIERAYDKWLTSLPDHLYEDDDYDEEEIRRRQDAEDAAEDWAFECFRDALMMQQIEEAKELVDTVHPTGRK